MKASVKNCTHNTGFPCDMFAIPQLHKHINPEICRESHPQGCTCAESDCIMACFPYPFCKQAIFPIGIHIAGQYAEMTGNSWHSDSLYTMVLTTRARSRADGPSQAWSVGTNRFHRPHCRRASHPLTPSTWKLHQSATTDSQPHET